MSWCFDIPRRIRRPQRIGGRIVVKEPSITYTPGPAEVVVDLLPAATAGHGIHPTARLCGQAMERYLCPGDNVVDVGTGPALLALCAARLGAGRVTAFDEDEQSISTARDNVSLNHLIGVVSVVHTDEMGRVAARLAGRIHLVVANVLPGIAERIAPHVGRLLAGNGIFIVGGLRAETVAPLDRAVSEFGMTGIDVLREEDWSCRVFRKEEGRQAVTTRAANEHRTHG